MAREPAYVDLKKTVVRDSKGRRITDEYIRKSLKEFFRKMSIICICI
jgi:hypothetical protein